MRVTLKGGCGLGTRLARALDARTYVRTYIRTSVRGARSNFLPPISIIQLRLIKNAVTGRRSGVYKEREASD